MKLLLDTHVVVAVCREQLTTTYPEFAQIEVEQDGAVVVSVASLWEIAIKSRIGKLDPGRSLDQLARYLTSLGLVLLPIEHEHVTASVEPQPPTRDPFDRLLLAQCQVERLQLVTADRALADHPLAWRG